MRVPFFYLRASYISIKVGQEGFGVTVANILFAPSTPSTFAVAAIHGRFSPVGALTPLQIPF